MAVLKHSVLCTHRKQASGVARNPYFPFGKTVSSSPKQSGYFLFLLFIDRRLEITCLLFVAAFIYSHEDTKTQRKKFLLCVLVPSWRILFSSGLYSLWRITVEFAVYSLEITIICKANVSVFTDNKMFMDCNSHYLARMHQLTGHRHIFL